MPALCRYLGYRWTLGTHGGQPGAAARELAQACLGVLTIQGWADGAEV